NKKGRHEKGRYARQTGRWPRCAECEAPSALIARRALPPPAFPPAARHANDPRMRTRIDIRFETLRAARRAALVTFVMAGDPDSATSLAIIKALPAAGADMIEIGMPFTDPMADGPAIQAAGLRALQAGQTLRDTLALAKEFRGSDPATPVV